VSSFANCGTVKLAETWPDSRALELAVFMDAKLDVSNVSAK
jgi:hypothetical protein